MFKPTTYLLIVCSFLFSRSANAQKETIVFPRNSVWKYLDNGSDQGSQWTATNFDDAAWKSGAAELGYGDGGETTLLGFGPSSSNKFATTYFRTNFNLTTLPKPNEYLALKLKRDDGAIVYFNGVEAYRVNMPMGNITYDMFANGTVDGGNETTFFVDSVKYDALKIGNNTIAVEIHQVNATSSDISFDLELTYTEIIPLVAPVICNQTLGHISQFVSVQPSAQPDSLRIPPTHTFQMIVQSGDPYSDTIFGNTKGLFDFTGYVPIKGSSKNGYLSINHEGGSTPSAGVSMLSLNFDTANHIWNVTNNVPVDFSKVFGTGRNCSGTVTPWNTIITSEETLPTIDANNDGYQDIGWHVEVDPATASVVGYNGSAPQKLWRMGRMSHENVVVATDNKTVYAGNDENPGYVFKFVADKEKDLSEGLLYVLKLDAALDATTTGTWIGIPNFTPTDCNNVRAYATAVGATNFFNVEDVEISPLDGKIYFTSKSSSRVYRFKDEGTKISAMEVFVGNTNFEYVIQTQDGLVKEQWRGGMDNLTFDDKGNLYCLQDGGRGHIWMVPPCHTQNKPAVKLFAVTPAGCEPTGMTFSPDFKFMFLSIMHPSGNNATPMIDATGTPVVFNKETAIVIARKEVLGPEAIDNVIQPQPSGIKNINKTQLMDIYPNPTNGIATIKLMSNNAASVVVHVYNILGSSARLISKSLVAGENKLDIDMTNLPAGIYTVNMLIDGQNFATKLIKE